MNTPRKLGPGGRKLWLFVTEAFELAEHELALLEEACRIRDRVAQMQAQVEADGVMIPSSQGMRLHPAIAEERAQRLALIRALGALNVPTPEDIPSPRGRR